MILLHLVGINPVIVHGGGPQIGALMKRLGKEPQFVGGMRVTDEETVEIVEMVLVGKINKEIVGLINHHGGRAVGLSRQGRRPDPARTSGCTGLPTATMVDIGLVGEVERVNAEPIRLLEERRLHPGDRAGRRRRAAARPTTSTPTSWPARWRRRWAPRSSSTSPTCRASRATDGQLISTLTRKDAERLIRPASSTAACCPRSSPPCGRWRAGTAKAHIIDGRVPHAILLELFTREGVGTEIVL